MKTNKMIVGFLFVLISFFGHAQDTLRPDKALYVKALPDSIFINKYNKTEHQGMLLTKGETLKLMKTKANARTEVRMTNMFRWFAAVSVIEGVVSAIDFGTGASQGNFNWVVGSVALIDFIVAATMQQQVNKHLDKAIKLYNTKPGVTSVKGLKPELGVASKGFGVCLRF